MEDGELRPDVLETLRHRRDLDARIGVLAAQIHALEAELVTVLAEHDTAGGWQSGGYRTHSQWISVRTKFTTGDSRRVAGIAARIESVPTLMADARDGKVSLGLIAAAARVTTPENEERVAELVRCCTPAQATRVLGSYRNLTPQPDTDDSAESPEPIEQEPDLWWRQWVDETGRHRVDAALDPVTGALLEQARHAARAATERAATEPAATERAAGSGEERQPRRPSPDEITAAMASTALEAVNSTGISDRGGERFAIQVTCDLATLAAVLGLTFDSKLPVHLGSRAYLCATGQHLSNSQLARLACDADLQLLIEHDGAPLWLGNTARLFNRHQRRAMKHRSGGNACEFPGCSTAHWVEAHHIIDVDHDGVTDLPNGVLLCSYHHHQLHRQHWNVTRSGTQLTFWNGTTCLGSTGPPGPAPSPPPDLGELPHLAAVPEPPPHIGPNSPKSGTGGERLTRYALDVFLSHLLAA